MFPAEINSEESLPHKFSDKDVGKKSLLKTDYLLSHISKDMLPFM
jgi:hypothetical protein